MGVVCRGSDVVMVTDHVVTVSCFGLLSLDP